MRITLFHPSSQKRGLERFLSRAGVKVFRFDVTESLNVIPSLQELYQYKPHKHISTATV